jgi:integrase
MATVKIPEGMKGVKHLGGNTYEVRGTWHDPTRKGRPSVERVIEAANPWEAKSILTRLVEEAQANGNAPAEAGPERLTFVESVERWLAAKAVDTKRVAGHRESTKRVYRSHLAAWLEEIPGDTWVDKIATTMVTRAMDGWLEDDAAPNTVNARLRFLRAWAHAVGADQCVRGIAVVPLGVQRKHEGGGLTPSELARWLELAPKATGDLWPLYAAIFGTGMRLGEALALEVRDVDEHTGLVKIERAVWEGNLGTPKTDAGFRRVYLTGLALEAMREHLRALRRKHSSIALPPTMLLFPSERPSEKHPYRTSGAVRRRLMAVYDGAQIDLDGRSPVHCLRHTYNNVLRTTSPELVRQAMLGHSDEGVGKIYSKATDAEIRAASEATMELLLRAAGRDRD